MHPSSDAPAPVYERMHRPATDARTVAENAEAGIWRLIAMAWAVVPRQHYKLTVVVFLLSTISALIDLAGIGSIYLLTAVFVEGESARGFELTQRLLDAFALQTKNEVLAALGVVTLLLIVLRNVALFAEGVSQFRFRYAVERDLASRLLERYLLQPVAFFHSVNTTNLSRNVLMELRQITGYLLDFLQMTSATIGSVVIIAGIIGETTAASLGAIALLGAFYSIFYMAVRRYLVRLGHEKYRSNGQRFVASAQALGSVRESKLYGVEQAFLSRFDSASASYLGTILKSQVLTLLPRHFLEITMFCGLAAIILMQAQSTGDIRVAAAPLVLIGAALYRVVPRVDMLVRSVLNLKVTNAAILNVSAALSLPAEDIERSLGEPPLPLHDSLRLDGVTFWYGDEERPALQDISLELPSRGIIAIAGESGAGKSTMVDLITGLTYPQRGAILIDGQPLDRSRLDRWRRSVAYVAQSPAILDDTIMANIRFGQTGAQCDDDSVVRAARLAQLDELVSSFPNGYETQVGEGGSNLSGGQRQRVALARALVRNAEIIVLDEATNALDPRSENAILGALRNLSKDRLILIIAHRFSLVQAAEKVVYLDRGRLRVYADYDTLIREDPVFRSLASSDQPPAGDLEAPHV